MSAVVCRAARGGAAGGDCGAANRLLARSSPGVKASEFPRSARIDPLRGSAKVIHSEHLKRKTMIAKCPCQQCGVNIEFEVENANQFVPCPSCGKQTRLLIPGSREHAQTTHAAKLNAKTEAKIMPCPDCGLQVSRRALFCPGCGAFERRLFWNIWRIVSTFWLVSLVFAVLGLIIWKLFMLAGE